MYIKNVYIYIYKCQCGMLKRSMQFHLRLLLKTVSPLFSYSERFIGIHKQLQELKKPQLN